MHISTFDEDEDVADTVAVVAHDRGWYLFQIIECQGDGGSGNI